MLVTAAVAVTAAGSLIVTGAVVVLQLLISVTLTVYGPGANPVNIPLAAPVTFRRASTRR